MSSVTKRLLSHGFWGNVVMPRSSSFSAITLLSGLLVCTSVSCGQRSDLTTQLTGESSEASTTVAKATKPTVAGSAEVSPVQPPTKVDTYQLAIERASNAYTIGKSAQSRDDWRLVANRWQQAINLMKSVPTSSPHHLQAKQKLSEYQKNLAYAQRLSNQSTAALNPDGVIVLSPEALARPQTPAPIAAAPQPDVANSNRVFYAPIIRREGNTPVVRVLFNNQQPFDMIVDTGASGTLITRQMASSLGVVPISQANVDTASQRGVAFPLGYVQSVEVGGMVAHKMLVAVAGPELDIGLLGHDFFGHYDVTIRQNEVEFRER